MSNPTVEQLRDYLTSDPDGLGFAGIFSQNDDRLLRPLLETKWPGIDQATINQALPTAVLAARQVEHDARQQSLVTEAVARVKTYIDLILKNHCTPDGTIQAAPLTDYAKRKNDGRPSLNMDQIPRFVQRKIRKGLHKLGDDTTPIAVELVKRFGPFYHLDDLLNTREDADD